MIVSRWTQTEVRALRIAALRETQEEFAERAGFGLPTIKKWHRATGDRPVRGRSAEVLDTMLAQLDDDQRARFATELHLNSAGPAPRAQPAPPSTSPTHGFGLYAWEVDADVKRREFGKLAAVVTASAFAFSPDTWQFGERVGRADVDRLLAGVDLLEAEDQRVGGGRLVQFAVQQLAAAKHRLDVGSYSPEVGNAFAAATGRLALMAGWFAADSDRHPLTRRCYADALALATEADDETLIADTCLYAANQAIGLARRGYCTPHSALKYIDRARTLTRGKPPGRIHALIAAREAQAQALMADRTAFDRAIATAWRELDHALMFESPEDAPQWLRFVTAAEIHGHEARGYGALGDWGRSVQVFEEVLSGDEADSPRNATNTSAWAAAAKARLGEVADALETGHQVLAELESVASVRTLRVLEPVRDVDPGGDFRDRFDQLDAAMSRKALMP
ncbi:hypothetical protein [Nocardia farcinica]|nr:hypothetical protein [Nocardia farcinica]